MLSRARRACAPAARFARPFFVVVLAAGLAAAYFRDALVAAVEARVHGRCDLASAPAGGPALPPFSRYARAPPTAAARRVDFVWVSVALGALLDSVGSVCHFYASPATLHVILPARDVAAARASLRAACRAPALELLVWSEADVVPEFGADDAHGGALRFPGTLRQMTLKLAAAGACVTAADWYVVMDADVYARRRFAVGDLLVEGARGAPPRARTDFDFPWHAQPRSWTTEAGAVLGTPLAAATHAWCAARQSPLTPRARAALDAARPFALAEGGRVYGACHSGRGDSTHVTPMIFSVELIRRVLAPRLAARGALSALSATYGGHGNASWYASALHFHAERVALCAARGVDVGAGRFYSWTEYALYFVAAVAAEALDDFHAFPSAPGVGDTGLLSFAHSAFDPASFDWWSPAATLDDARDAAPLFLVHSWLGSARPAARDAVHKLLVERGVVAEAGAG